MDKKRSKKNNHNLTLSFTGITTKRAIAYKQGGKKKKEEQLQFQEIYAHKKFQKLL